MCPRVVILCVTKASVGDLRRSHISQTVRLADVPSPPLTIARKEREKLARLSRQTSRAQSLAWGLLGANPASWTRPNVLTSWILAVCRASASSKACVLTASASTKSCVEHCISDLYMCLVRHKPTARSARPRAQYTSRAASFSMTYLLALADSGSWRTHSSR
eukprot:scaffold111495_cov72-Phaeocystis_antarctica.AAC.4